MCVGCYHSLWSIWVFILPNQTSEKQAHSASVGIYLITNLSKTEIPNGDSLFWWLQNATYRDIEKTSTLKRWMPLERRGKLLEGVSPPGFVLFWAATWQETAEISWLLGSAAGWSLMSWSEFSGRVTWYCSLVSKKPVLKKCVFVLVAAKRNL